MRTASSSTPRRVVGKRSRRGSLKRLDYVLTASASPRADPGLRVLGLPDGLVVLSVGQLEGPKDIDI
jgi:hypothetical protein